MSLKSLRSLARNRAVRVGALLVLAATAAVVLAACGSLNKTTSSSAGSTRAVQVLYTVKSGDLVETAAGRATLTSTKKGKVTATVAVAGAEASQVAAGQTATVVFFKSFGGLRPGGGSGGQGYGFGVRPSGAPSPGSGGYFGGSGSGGQGYFGGSGGQGFFGSGGASRFGGKTATATVAEVQAGSNGAVTATIAIAKLPSGVTTTYTGIAQITVKTLAQNVLIVPRAAIKGSGSSATVQLLQAGKTVTQSVTVGQETQDEAEITSGLSAGQSIVYTRTFSGFPGFRNGRPGAGYGGYGGGSFSGGSLNGGGQSNSQSSGTTGGV